MSVSVSSAGPVTTARLSGEIDTYSVPDVRAAFERLPVVSGGTVVVDLREVTFLDSSGLGAIIALYHRADASTARLRLACGEVTLRLVQLMHLDQVMDVVGEPSDAPTDPQTSAPA
ncbi:anti-sigma-B factor antagonist [Terrabacter tumescens]|uniref:Anti-sigma-B factor antagonist n=1 Tax=Terrabacter tumescens TaxID=60443 RepID=A0ABQ2HIJ1_9MICO|nr:STAS domain-containing protein [Terrabacter tumescens]GGM82047.1 anti-sigma-B factor antagonist [Terrabacter tumescens]